MKLKKLKIMMLSLFLGANLFASDVNLTKEEAIKIIQPFYGYLVGKATRAEVDAITDSNWRDHHSNKKGDSWNKKQSLDFLGGPYQQMLPNMKYEMKRVYISGNDVIVRGSLESSPNGKMFLGTPIKEGKTFKIMTIDIHTIKNGKMIKSYHLEDMLGALKQLK